MFSQTGREDFWGVELSSKKKTVQWPDEDEEESEEDVEHTLFLHYACLGIGAKTSEPNIITLTTQDGNGEDLTLPIAWLSGNNPQVSMRLPVNPPVVLKLAQGSGPVAIGGVHEQVLDDIGLSDEEEEEEDQEEKEEASSPEVASKITQEVSRKRPAPSPATSAGKKDAKVMKKKEEDEEEEDDDDEDEEDDDESSGEELDRDEVIKYLKAKGMFNGARKDDDEEESEDDDEEDDDEDEEEDDSEEEEMEQLPAPKKKQSAKQPAPQQKAKDTPQAAKPQKGKTPQSGKKGKEVTPATVKVTPKAKPAATSVDQVKARLLKSPNLPKKPEKFANFVKNTFKIDDPSVHKQLWEFVQKSKK